MTRKMQLIYYILLYTGGKKNRPVLDVFQNGTGEFITVLVVSRIYCSVASANLLRVSTSFFSCSCDGKYSWY